MSVGTGDLITRIYGGFCGVDFRGADISITRSPDSKNVWKDYKEIDSIRTRPAMRLLRAFDKPVYGIHFANDKVYVHYGDALVCYDAKDFRDRLIEAKPKVPQEGLLNEQRSFSFSHAGSLYLKDGKKFFYCADGSAKEVKGYAPTTTIGRKPSGGGTVYEDVNMLTLQRCNSFVGDGKSTEYHLDKNDIASIDYIEIDDKPYTDLYEVDLENGIVKFGIIDADKITHTIPPAPKTTGQDNVKITFTVSGNNIVREKIERCSILQVFDNRVFYAGNPDYPNMMWHSSLDTPSYISDLDYYQEGLDNAMITGLVAGNNALWVFREPSQENTTVFYHTPTIDADYGKIYPSQHSSISTGCIGGAINFNDDIVFFSDRGLEGISGDIMSEQVVSHRSSLVDRKLIAESKYRDAVLAEWEGYLLVFVGNKVYLADSRAKFAYNDHVEYDWFYWELEKDIICACVDNGVLYLGTTDGVYTLDDYETDVESYWSTPKDKFSAANKVKTTNKRGMVAEATGDLSVYVKTEDSDFELIGDYTDVKDYFVSRIKRKKWKDIQLKFHSNTRFSLETATLEAFIGGYIKR